MTASATDRVIRRLPTADDTVAFGRTLGALLRAGDLVVLTGSLGAGKTTLARGIGEGLGVRGPITSPTFVIAREHRNLGDGPCLVHVDAYRLGGVLDVDGLDLDSSIEECVTVVEWGQGFVEGLTDDRIDVELLGQQARSATVTGVGPRGMELVRSLEAQ